MSLSGKSVAVVGAGVAGLCAAVACADRGAAVTVFEREPFPPEESASALAGGMLAPIAELESLPLTLSAVGAQGTDVWAELLSGTDAYFRRTGALVVAHGPDRPMLERFAAHLAAAPPGSWERVDGARIAELEPDLAGRFTQGLYLRDEGHLEPGSVMAALAARLTERSGRIVDRTAVEPEAVAPDFDHMIDCRGYVSEAEDPDLRGVKGEIAVVETAEVALSRPVRMMHPRYPLYVVPHPGGRLAVGATMVEDSAGADGRVFVRSALELLSAAYALHPALGEAKIASLASGVRPAYPDNLPRITERACTSHPCKGGAPGGVSLRCNGLFRHGYLLAPAMGRAAAARLAGQDDPAWPLFTGRMNGGPQA